MAAVYTGPEEPAEGHTPRCLCCRRVQPQPQWIGLLDLQASGNYNHVTLHLNVPSDTSIGGYAEEEPAAATMHTFVATAGKQTAVRCSASALHQVMLPVILSHR